MHVTNTNIDRVVAILKDALKDLPEPSVTLVGKKWKTPFHVLICCLLSLRTKDQTTLPASQRLFALANSPSQMLKVSIDKIQKAIYPVGFYRTKARTIHGVCRDILEKFGGQVPNDLDTLMTIKGVGRKTANLVLTEGFCIKAICVDTHVHRISNRFGYVKTKDPYETEMALRKQLPQKFWIDYNAILVLWGQNVCKPISPLCSNCPLVKICGRVGVTQSR